MSSGEDAVAMLMAGANAVEVGHGDLRRPARALAGRSANSRSWMARHDVARVDELIGAAHG